MSLNKWTVIARAPSSTCCVVEFMNQFCHGEERSDAAIHLDFSWIATPDFVGLAMTNDGCSLAGGPPRGTTKQSNLDRHGAPPPSPRLRRTGRAPRDDRVWNTRAIGIRGIALGICAAARLSSLPSTVFTTLPPLRAFSCLFVAINSDQGDSEDCHKKAQEFTKRIQMPDYRLPD